MTTKIPPLRHSLPPKPQVAPTVPSEDLVRLNRSLTEESKRRQSLEADPSSPLSADTFTRSTAFPDLLLSPSSLSPGLTTCSTSLTSLHDISPLLSSHSSMSAWRRSYFDGSRPATCERPLAAALPSAQPLSLGFNSDRIIDTRDSPSRIRSMTDMAMLAEAFSKTQIEPHTLSSYQNEQSYSHGQSQTGSAYSDLRSSAGMGTAPVLIPMQASGDGLPLTSVVETLASKGSRAAAENPETVAHAWKLRQWGIGIGPGVNPKVVTNRNGSQSRARSAADDPPIVNTGNSGPMCVQPGDWICTACGFVNWRRRKVCMRCYPFAEGNEVCQGIHGGELLAKRLAGGLDPTSEEFQQSLQALYPDRPKRTTEANPHHYSHMQEHEHYDPSTAHDSPVQAEMANVLGIHTGVHSMSPYSPYVPHSYGQNGYPQQYYHAESLMQESPSLVHEDTALTAERIKMMQSFREPAPEPHRSIWAPAPKRPVPVPMDPEDRDAAGRRAKLEPIGTRTSSTYTKFNSSGTERLALADREINNTSNGTIKPIGSNMCKEPTANIGLGLINLGN